MFYANLNRANMRRRLFYIYKWVDGRREASREGYIQWLRELVTWMEDMTGVELPPEPEIEGVEEEFFGDEGEFNDSEEDLAMFGEEEPSDEGAGDENAEDEGSADTEKPAEETNDAEEGADEPKAEDGPVEQPAADDKSEEDEKAK